MWNVDDNLQTHQSSASHVGSGICLLKAIVGLQAHFKISVVLAPLPADTHFPGLPLGNPHNMRGHCLLLAGHRAHWVRTMP